MKHCVVFSSRPVGRSLLAYVPPGAYIIAADAGWQNAEALGVKPNLVLGDFDSAPVPPGASGLICLPAEKDDTDTLFAVKEALRRGFTRVTILGGLGGRLDHTLANLQTLLHLAESGASGLLADETTEVRCMGPGVLELPRRENRFLSVLAAGGAAEGVCLRGVKYPLQDATLVPGFPLGVSNEIVDEFAQISCKKGYLYVLLCDEI